MIWENWVTSLYAAHFVSSHNIHIFIFEFSSICRVYDRARSESFSSVELWVLYCQQQDIVRYKRAERKIHEKKFHLIFTLKFFLAHSLALDSKKYFCVIFEFVVLQSLLVAKIWIVGKGEELANEKCEKGRKIICWLELWIVMIIMKSFTSNEPTKKHKQIGNCFESWKSLSMKLHKRFNKKKYLKKSEQRSKNYSDIQTRRKKNQFRPSHVTTREISHNSYTYTHPTSDIFYELISFNHRAIVERTLSTMEVVAEDTSGKKWNLSKLKVFNHVRWVGWCA